MMASSARIGPVICPRHWRTSSCCSILQRPFLSEISLPHGSQNHDPAKLFSLLHFCNFGVKTAFTESLQGFFRGRQPRF
jgi:hypothetical protein